MFTTSPNITLTETQKLLLFIMTEFKNDPLRYYDFAQEFCKNEFKKQFEYIPELPPTELIYRVDTYWHRGSVTGTLGKFSNDLPKLQKIYDFIMSKKTKFV